jgi:aspartate carbamoyltransferase
MCAMTDQAAPNATSQGSINVMIENSTTLCKRVEEVEECETTSSSHSTINKLTDNTTPICAKQEESSNGNSQSTLNVLTDEASTWKKSSFLSVQQITPSGLRLLFDETQKMRNLVRTVGGDDRLKHIVLATVFFEASTRTSCSFQAACLRLGGRSVHVDGIFGNSSAAKKGESLEDTCKCLECYADILVLRHPVQGSVERVINCCAKPVLNAGDGIGEHPTQALLDVFTIFDELKLEWEPVMKPLTVVLLGDLKHGRTVHSLAKLLGSSCIWGRQLTLRYCSPLGLEMPRGIIDYVNSLEGNIVQETYTDLKDACRGANVLYVTRIQQERFETNDEYELVKVRISSI